MKFGIIFLFVLSIFSAAEAQWKPWQIPTPRENHPIPANGSSVNFPNVNLPVGMNYHVNASGRITVSSNPNEFADARYYVNILTFPPTAVPVSLKMRYASASEDWFNSAVAPAQLAGYQTSHIYDASVASTGSPLAFRFFDTKDPAVDPTRYNDNSGSITVEVAQETPRVAVQFDTVYFNNVRVGSSLRLLDSIEGYGVHGYRLDNVALTGPAAAKFSASSQNPTPFVLTESTNEFEFIYTPNATLWDTAYFHLYSGNAYPPDQHRIIVLIGQGVGVKLKVQPDTLDFKTVKVNSSTQLVATVSNGGSVDAVITSITITPPGSPFTVSPSSATVAAKGSTSFNVTFNPPANIAYFSTFTCAVNDGSTLVFYAKGNAGIGIPKLSDSVLDFGIVILNRSKSLPATLTNVGTMDINVVSTFNSNPAEYSVIGAQGAFPVSGGSSNGYGFTFKPITHLPGWQNHNGSFTYNFADGTSKTIIFKAADHKPLDVRLNLDSASYTNPGKNVTVRLRMLDPLDSALIPIRSVSDRISYDASLFDLISVQKGALVSASDWKLAQTSNPGYIDFSLNATTERLGPIGTLLSLTFKAHDNSQPGQYTTLTQSNTNFPYPDEPTAITNQGTIIITDICTPVHLTSNSTPTANSIEQSNPNPCVSQTTIRFGVLGKENVNLVPVKISLFDAMGRLVTNLVDESKMPGYYEIQLNATQLPNGLYFYTLESGSSLIQRSLIISK